MVVGSVDAPEEARADRLANLVTSALSSRPAGSGTTSTRISPMARADRRVPIAGRQTTDQMSHRAFPIRRKLDPNVLDATLSERTKVNAPDADGTKLLARVDEAKAKLLERLPAYLEAADDTKDELIALDDVNRAMSEMLEIMEDDWADWFETFFVAAYDTRLEVRKELSRLSFVVLAKGTDLTNDLAKLTGYLKDTLEEEERHVRPEFPDGDKPPTYQLVTGKLFDGQPKPADVVQGALGDCWLLGPLAAAVNTEMGRQRITNIVTGTPPVFQVTFFMKEDDKLVESPPISVASSFPMTSTNTFAYALAQNQVPSKLTGKPIEATTPLWPAVIEKAWAQRVGGYGKLDGGGQPGAAFEAIFGRASSTNFGESLADNTAKADIIGRVDGGEPVVISTPTHYVAVVAADDTHITIRDQSLYGNSADGDKATTRMLTWAELGTIDWRGGGKKFEYYATFTG